MFYFFFISFVWPIHVLYCKAYINVILGPCHILLLNKKCDFPNKAMKVKLMAKESFFLESLILQ